MVRWTIILSLLASYAHAELDSTITIPPPIHKKESQRDAQAPLMKVPASLDLALGQFQIDEVSCTLNHAYSAVSKDLFDDNKLKYEVLMTNRPISAKIFNQAGQFESLLPKNQCWVYFEIENAESLNPIHAFIPGKPQIIHSAPAQPFLRKQFDIKNQVLGATVLFKDPLLAESNAKMTGQFSLRTQFRKLGRSVEFYLKDMKFVGTNAFKPYQDYAALDRQEQSRSIASISPTASDDGRKYLPHKIEFQHGFINQKLKAAAVIVQGTFSEEQIANGMMTVKPEFTKEGTAQVFGIILMREKNGRWVKDEERWVGQLPSWAVGKEKIPPKK